MAWEHVVSKNEARSGQRGVRSVIIVGLDALRNLDRLARAPKQCSDWKNSVKTRTSEPTRIGSTNAWQGTDVAKNHHTQAYLSAFGERKQHSNITDSLELELSGSRQTKSTSSPGCSI